MTSCLRLIPRLDIKGPNLVKGIHLEGLRVLGKPEDFAEYYYGQGADELLYMDVVASLYGRNSLDDLISKTARSIFIPLTVGGGIRTIADIKRILRAGADKVAINTAAIKRPDFISEAANVFGSSTIVLSIEASKQSNGNYLAFTDNGREHTDKEVISWAREAAELGAGELIITSIDKEGTGLGFDIDLMKKINQQVTIPVIAGGGMGKKADLLDLLNASKVEAISLASVLHYAFIKNKKVNRKDFTTEGNVDFIKSGQKFHNLELLTIPKIKRFLSQSGFLCRQS